MPFDALNFILAAIKPESNIPRKYDGLDSRLQAGAPAWAGSRRDKPGRLAAPKRRRSSFVVRWNRPATCASRCAGI